jgi:hypothetical protein
VGEVQEECESETTKTSLYNDLLVDCVDLEDSEPDSEYVEYVEYSEEPLCNTLAHTQTVSALAAAAAFACCSSPESLRDPPAQPNEVRGIQSGNSCCSSPPPPLGTGTCAQPPNRQAQLFDWSCSVRFQRDRCIYYVGASSGQAERCKRDRCM